MDPTRVPRCRLRATLARLALVALFGSAFAAFAQTAPAQPEAFRPEIATPLQAAEALIREKKYDEALARIRQADAVPDRTPGENVAIERMRAIAASGAGDIVTATRSFETVIASGRVTPADQAKMVQVVAQLYFQGKDYPKAATWASRSLKESGPNADMRWLLIRAQYLADDCANASRELRALIDADAKTAAAPAQERLQMLATLLLRSSATTPATSTRSTSSLSTIRRRSTGPMRSAASRASRDSRIGFGSTCCGCGMPPARSAARRPTRR